MGLTDREVQTAKANLKVYKLRDANGLYLAVLPSGVKSWRYDFKFANLRKTLTIGQYPVVTLKTARDRHLEARRLIFDGIDPCERKRNSRRAATGFSQNAFGAVAREWFAQNEQKWVIGHKRTILSRLERDVFPFIGSLPMNALKAPVLLEVLRRVENRGAIESAHRILQLCNQIFKYGIITSRCESNPAEHLGGALKPIEPKHFAALTNPNDVAALMRSIEGYVGSAIVKIALQLFPLLFLRSRELRFGEWSEIDFENRIWSIPADRMKMGEPHIVPLSNQSVVLLKELHFHSGGGKFMFPSPRSIHRPMSNNAVLSALRRMGYTGDDMTVHGFRAMARTILDEVLEVRVEFIEHQLAHAVRDANGRAYNRTTHLEQRREMMQRWADYLEEIKNA